MMTSLTTMADAGGDCAGATVFSTVTATNAASVQSIGLDQRSFGLFMPVPWFAPGASVYEWVKGNRRVRPQCQEDLVGERFLRIVHLLFRVPRLHPFATSMVENAPFLTHQHGGL